jgi:hypothetical protein
MFNWVDEEVVEDCEAKALAEANKLAVVAQISRLLDIFILIKKNEP